RERALPRGVAGRPVRVALRVVGLGHPRLLRVARLRVGARVALTGARLRFVLIRGGDPRPRLLLHAVGVLGDVGGVRVVLLILVFHVLLDRDAVERLGWDHQLGLVLLRRGFGVRLGLGRLGTLWLLLLLFFLFALLLLLHPLLFGIHLGGLLGIRFLGALL